MPFLVTWKAVAQTYKKPPDEHSTDDFSEESMPHGKVSSQVDIYPKN